ncbi:MAG TPA: c-type cytochrome [Candidatus Acidoferrales bacterium]|nr:c-type cytochrome [Candidatus Acidoferrales bacterium]
MIIPGKPLPIDRSKRASRRHGQLAHSVYCLAALLVALFLAAIAARAQAGNGEKGVINFLEPKLSDPVLQHSKEIYVLNGCAYCHGVDLKVRNGEAADLMHSALVGADVDGNLLAPLLRSGIPQTPKLSPMPQFSDLSDREIADIVRWIHYARQDGRYKELASASDSAPGDAVAGKTYFDQRCGSCHSKQGDLSNAVGKYGAAALKLQILRPDVLQPTPSWRVGDLNNTKLITARKQHQKLLENYSASDVANVFAYLQMK